MPSVKFKIYTKWRLAVSVLPFLVVIVALKFGAHYMGWEFLSLNTLFTGIISANIFLIGFLLSGVLVDYKESEKIPGDLAASFETLADECLILHKSKKTDAARMCLIHLTGMLESTIRWFYKKERTQKLLDDISDLSEHFFELEPHTQANFIVRLKQEQHLIRKMIIRVHTIRETTFVGAGYAITELITFILVCGLIFIRIDPYYESVFFVAFVSFVLIYMILFIRDLDNPFGYTQSNNHVEDVPLKPLEDARSRIRARFDQNGFCAKGYS
jgi:hypothetical protein